MGVAAIGPCDKYISTTISMPLHKEVPHKNVQIGNDQEMAQSERNSHSTKFQVDRPSTLVRPFEIVDDDGRLFLFLFYFIFISIIFYLSCTYK